MEESSNVRGTQAKIKMIQTNLSTSKKFLKFMEGKDPKIISKPPTVGVQLLLFHTMKSLSHSLCAVVYRLCQLKDLCCKVLKK